MPQSNRSTVADETVAAYDRLIATVQGLERKGATLPYTSVNGNTFSFLDEAGILALRLGPEDRERFMTTFDARLQEAHGRVMKEFVSVPQAVLGDPDALTPWFGTSWRYASGLKPKPTTRTKRA